jgi:hypothetical protein
LRRKVEWAWIPALSRFFLENTGERMGHEAFVGIGKRAGVRPWFRKSQRRNLERPDRLAPGECTWGL